MISVSEASRIVNENLFIPSIETINMGSCMGRVLAEDIYADRDFPPFDRVMMDGIAIRAEDFNNGVRSFKIDGLLAAGAHPMKVSDHGHCVEIMTGAVMAEGADTVIRYEDVEINDGIAKVNIDEIRLGQNVHSQGMDRKEGDLIIKSDTKISVAELGVLATVGKSEVKVKSLPKVLIVSTGDELVEVNEAPLPHQIRKSNVHVLDSICQNLGVEADMLHLVDDKSDIRESLESSVRTYDVILLSGGVSKGKKDFLPEILDELRVEKLFHRVAQRPGKPFWFGRNDMCTVFAFPGNPVSTLVCATRYFKPWLSASLGEKSPVLNLPLSEAFEFKPALTYFLQVEVSEKDGVSLARPVPGQGSGDLANLVDADGFIQLPSERSTFDKGEHFPYYPFRNV